MTMDPSDADTPLAGEVDKMAEVTRQHAEHEDPDQRTPAGSHGMPGSDGDGQPDKLGQGGVGQSDDISGQAPAAGMARQKSNPTRRQ